MNTQPGPDFNYNSLQQNAGQWQGFLYEQSSNPVSRAPPGLNTDSATIEQNITHWRVIDMAQVPMPGGETYSELAQEPAMSHSDLARFLRVFG